jgi:hypothetical protein
VRAANSRPARRSNSASSKVAASLVSCLYSCGHPLNSQDVTS